MEYKYLLDIGLIIAVVKIFTILTQKIKMPKVLGGLIAGIVLGPAVLNNYVFSWYGNQCEEVYRQ